MSTRGGHSGRVQTFPYTLRTVACADTAASTLFASNAIGLELVNPVDLYAVKSLAFHAKFTHTGTDQAIIQIQVQDGNGNIIKSMDVSTVVTGHVVEISRDISHMINPTGRNIVYVVFADVATVTINIFKVDMLYQVKGIR